MYKMYLKCNINLCTPRVCHLAGEFVRKLSKKHPGKICEKDELCVRLAGLCHDLGKCNIF